MSKQPNRTFPYPRPEPLALAILTPFQGKWWTLDPWLLALDRIRHLPSCEVSLLWLDNSDDPAFGARLAEEAKGRGATVVTHAHRFPTKNETVAALWRRIRAEIESQVTHVLTLEDDVLPDRATLARLWLELQAGGESLAAVTAAVPFRYPSGAEDTLVWRYTMERVFPPGDACNEVSMKLQHLIRGRKRTQAAFGSGFGCLLLRRDALDAASLDASDPAGFCYDQHFGWELGQAGREYRVHWNATCTHLQPYALDTINCEIGHLEVHTNWLALAEALPRRCSGYLLVDRKVRLDVWVVPEAIVEEFAKAHQAQAAADSNPRLVRVAGAAFLVSRDQVVGLVPDHGHLCGAVLDWLWVALPVFCAPEGWEAIHAAAVVQGDTAYLIAGESGSGKTEVLLRLCRQGAEFLADDICLIHGATGHLAGWGRDLHLGYGQAKDWASEVPRGTVDFCGKIRAEATTCGLTRRTGYAQFWHHIVVLGEANLTHRMEGADTTWRPRWQAAERLANIARRWPRRADNIVGRASWFLRFCDAPMLNRQGRILLVNRDSEQGQYAWFGGDAVTVDSYVAGLREHGWQAAFVPTGPGLIEAALASDDTDCALVLHTQFPWSHDAIERLKGIPLLVMPLTHPQLPAEQVQPVLPVARAAKFLLCYDQTEADYYGSLDPELAPRCRIIPQGVRAALYDSHWAEPEPGRVFMAARFSSLKNQLTVLRACRNLGVPIIFAGPSDPCDGGAYELRFREEASAYTGAEVVGMLRETELWQQYARAWVHVNASLFEPYGLVTLEALALGANIVHTRKCWAAKQFAQWGSLCDPESEESVTAAIATELGKPRGWADHRPPTWGEAAAVLAPICEEAARR